MKTAIIYTTPTCKYCKEAKQFMDEKGVTYTEVDVSKDKEGLAKMLSLVGRASVPVIEVPEADYATVGFDRQKLAKALGISDE